MLTLKVPHSTIVTTLVALIGLACARTSATPGGPAGLAAVQRAEAGELVCESYCSPVVPGTALIEVRWVVTAQPTPDAKLREAAAEQTVDVSVYEDGFDRGLYVRLPAVRPEARFVPPPERSPKVQTVPGLERLSIRAVVPARDDRSDLRLARPTDQGATDEQIVLQVQGLQPGMNYYWRLRPRPQADPQVVMCRAPICPSDRRRRPGPDAGQ